MSAVEFPENTATRIFEQSGGLPGMRWEFGVYELVRDTWALAFTLVTYVFAPPVAVHESRQVTSCPWPGQPDGLPLRNHLDSQFTLRERMASQGDVFATARLEDKEVLMESLKGQCDPVREWLAEVYHPVIPDLDIDRAAVLMAIHFGQTALSPELAIQIENIDVRNRAIQFIGAERLFTELEARVIDEDVDPHGLPMRLLALPKVQGRRWLEVTDRTPGKPRAYLEAWPDVDSARETLARGLHFDGQQGMSAEEYYERLTLAT